MHFPARSIDLIRIPLESSFKRKYRGEGENMKSDRIKAVAMPIATVDQYKRALLTLRDRGLPTTYLTMLKAQYAANGAITSTKLAEAAGYENYNAANLHYGTLARHLAEILGYQPPPREDGSRMWWTCISYSEEGLVEPTSGHFTFLMRPELEQALAEMHWVRRA